MAGAALACMSVAAAAPLAYGDATTGRAAYEKGDYARAMSEWQSAADRGDAEAQFGLGSLYELGAGDLKQDYKRADYWYQKAAAQGYGEAQYRLALIWAAGGDNLPADLVEAYKWVLLAAESKGVWGSLAADLSGNVSAVTDIKAACIPAVISAVGAAAGDVKDSLDASVSITGALKLQ